MSRSFKFQAGSDFYLTAQMIALAGGFPVFSTDVSPSGSPKTFDLLVTRLETVSTAGDIVTKVPSSTIKSIANQAWVLGTNWFDTPQTDYQWSEDDVGYTFRYQCLNATIFNSTAAVAGALYRFSFTMRTETQGVWAMDFDGTAT